MAKYRVEICNREIRSIHRSEIAGTTLEPIVEESREDILWLTLHADSEAEAREKALRVVGKMKSGPPPGQEDTAPGPTPAWNGKEDQPGDRSSSLVAGAGQSTGEIIADDLNAASHGDPDKDLDQEEKEIIDTDYLDPDSMMK